MILTVLLSNSWLVNYKQPKKNNIGKVLCISWAVEICFYNQRSSKTWIRTFTACSHLKHSNNIPWIWGFSYERHWKSNSSRLMQNHRAWSGPQGKGKKLLLDIMSTQNTAHSEFHSIQQWTCEQFCKEIVKLSFLRWINLDFYRTEVYIHSQSY